VPFRQNVAMDLLTVHQRLYERTDGRLGHRLIGVPSALLRTTGRHTGQARTSALVYARDGDDYLVVAARIVAADDPDYPRLWDAVNENNHGRYRRYQAKTGREIPVVVLTPGT